MAVITIKEQELIDTLDKVQEGDKITLVGMNDFGFVQSSQTRFHSVEIKDSGFQKFIYLIHKPKNKRKYRRKSLDHRDIIILNGWIDIDTESQFKTHVDIDTIVKQSINTAFDQSFLKDVALIWENETLYSGIRL